MSIFKSFASNEDGNFAIMFSLAGAMLMAGVAVAIDMAGMQSTKSKLQSHLDSAALAAVAELSMNEDYIRDTLKGQKPSASDYEEVILKALIENGVDMRGVTPNVSIKDGVLTVSANIPHELQFGKLLNKKVADISGNTEIALPTMAQDQLDIALVLDNTASMNFDGKMTALRQGARDFITAIEDGGSGSQIALVPFARYVDIGVDNRDAFWLNVPDEFDTVRNFQQATHTGGTCHNELRTRFTDGVEEEYHSRQCTGQTTTYEPATKVIESRWIGCVGVRANELHMSDDTYLTEATRIQGLIHITPHEVLDGSWNEEAWCPDTVEPLTDDYDALRLRIGQLYGTDRTYIPAGLIWGQRILSPEAPFTESSATSRVPKRQIMILMSDGENTAYLEDDDSHEAIPYVEDLTSDEQAAGVIPPGTNEDTAALCESIKADGVEIYTIAFQVIDPMTHALLRNCASNPGNYTDAASNSALVETFNDISKSLEPAIRLMR